MAKTPHPAIKPDKSLVIRDFQRRYKLANRDMATICGCSLPTIQKWRSGEVAVSGAAESLMVLLDWSAEGEPEALRRLVKDLHEGKELSIKSRAPKEESKVIDDMSSMVDRLELMLENRRKEKELAESERRYLSVMEASEDPICRWKPNTTLTFVNEGYKRIYGLEGESLIGKKWIEFVPENQRQGLMTIIWDMARRGEGQRTLHDSLGNNGQLCYQEWQDVPIKDEKGEVVEFHSIGFDKTREVNLKNSMQEALDIQRAMMGLTKDAMIIFDGNGGIIEKNHHFADRFTGGSEIESLANLMEEEELKKLRRLLRHLQRHETLSYQFLHAGALVSITMQFASEQTKNRCFVAILEKHAIEQEALAQNGLNKREKIVLAHAPKTMVADKSRLVDTMKWIGLTIGISRAYAYKFSKDHKKMENVLEWHSSGTESKRKPNHILDTKDYDWWMKKLKKNQWIKIEDVEMLPRNALNERDSFRESGIRAVLISPVIVDGELVGFVGFNQNHTVRKWHEQEEEALKSLSLLVEDQFFSAK